MKYLLVLSVALLAGCSMSMEEVEHLVNSCKAVGGEPVVTKYLDTNRVSYVQCNKDGATYSDWKGKERWNTYWFFRLFY